jgi:hypothetical protein
VTYKGEQPRRAVAVVDNDSGDRSLVSSTDSRVMADMVRHDFYGARVFVQNDHFVLEPTNCGGHSD